MGGVPKAGDEESGRGEHDERHRHLADHERIAKPEPPGPGRRGEIGAKRARRLESGGAQRGEQRREHHGGSGDGQREEEDAAVDGELERHRHRQRGPEGAQRIRGPESQCDARGPAEDGEHQPLGEQLPDQAGPAPAQREPHRQLPPAHRGPRQQQIREIGAADQEDQTCDAHQESEELGDRTANAGEDPGLALGQDRHPALLPGDVGPLLGVRPVEPRRYHSELTLRLLDGGPVLQPADQREPAVTSLLQPIVRRIEHLLGGEAGPDLHSHAPDGATESARRHTTDGEGVSREPERSPDHTGVAAEAPDPETVGDHGLSL